MWPTVNRGYEDPPSYRIRHQGDPALMLGVIMEKHWNGLELDKRLKAQEARIQADLPLGVNFAEGLRPGEKHQPGGQ